MTEFRYPPYDEDHYLAMQGAVAHEVTPAKGEHTLIAKRCGVSRYAVLGWRRRYGIPPLQAEPLHLAKVDPRKKGNGPRKGAYSRTNINGCQEYTISGAPYRADALMSEEQIAALLGDRKFRDDPRAVRGRT